MLDGHAKCSTAVKGEPGSGVGVAKGKRIAGPAESGTISLTLSLPAKTCLNKCVGALLSLISELRGKHGELPEVGLKCVSFVSLSMRP